MKLLRMALKGFRNIEKADLSFSPGVNVIFGANAQGKTNLLEAIWLLGGSKSFRGARESQMVSFGGRVFQLEGEFSDRERIQKILYTGGEKKKVLLNGVPLAGASSLRGEFFSVVFTPEDLSLIKDGPEQRRDFLDVAIGGVKPVYSRYLAQYQNLLDQRNALLREISFSGRGREMLELWDSQLSKAGTAISILRSDYLRRLGTAAKEIYSGFSGSREEFSLSYRSSVFGEEPLSVYSDQLISRYAQALRDSVETDIKMRFTGKGVHRDDLEILIDGVSAKSFGSQGQQRSGAVALKLGEAAILKQVTGEDPIILLDDVMSELDASRQDYILNRVKNFQVFLTCCDLSHTQGLKEGRIFRAENGSFSPAEDLLSKKPEKE